MKHIKAYRVIDFHTQVLGRRLHFYRAQKDALESAKYICGQRKLTGRNAHIKYHKLLKTYVIYSERRK